MSLSIKTYNEAIRALQDLGFNETPSLNQIEDSLSDKQKQYIKKHKATLVITPPLALYGLIDKFDEKQSLKTYVYKDLWDQYDFGNSWRVDYALPELYFTNQTYEDQRQSLTKKQKEVKGLQSIDPRTYIMLNVIRRAAGKELLDSTTFTSFVQLDKKAAGGRSYVPRVGSYGGQLGFAGSVGDRDPRVGLGVSVGLDLDFKTISSSVSLPSELTINGKVYREV